MIRKATDQVTTIGIDIGKNNFHLIGLDGAGNIVLHRKLSRSQVIVRFSEITIGHYDRVAEDYWDGTRNHDVSQNYEALLEAIEGEPPYAILDLGCGPGRDLRYFRSLGHDVTGLDGSMEFVTMARR